MDKEALESEKYDFVKEITVLKLRLFFAMDKMVRCNRMKFLRCFIRLERLALQEEDTWELKMLVDRAENVMLQWETLR